MNNQNENQSSKLADQIKAQSSYKIREFEWFEVETKIRLFVQKLLEPTLKQIHDDRAIVDELESNFKQSNKEVTYLRDIVLNQGAGIPIFEEIKQKFIEIEMKIDLQKRQNIDEFAKITQQSDQMDCEIQKFLNLTKAFEYTKIKLEQDLTDIQLRNDNFKEGLEQVAQKLAQDLTDSTKSQKLALHQIEQLILKSEGKQQDLENQHKIYQEKMKNIQEQVIEINKKLSENQSSFQEIDTHLLKQDLSITNIKKQIQQIDMLDNKDKQIQMFLIYYLPIYIQTQISDSLFTCLPINLFYKLAQYEKMKLDEYDRNILEYNGNAQINILIEQYSKVVEEVTKRNTKIIQISSTTKNQKKLNTKSSDSDSDSINQKDDQNKSYSTFQRQIEGSQSRKRTESNQTRKQSLNKKQSLEKSLVYHEEQLQNLKSILETQIENLYIQFNNLEKSVQQNQQDLDRQHFLFQSQSQNNYDKLISTTSIQIKNIEETLKNIINQDQQIKEENVVEIVKKLKKVIQTILHFLVLITHLVIQDEIDRQGIQLMGAKETSIDDGLVYRGQSRKGPLQLNGECLSCSGQPLQLLQYFKVACLAYHPSDIIVDGKQFKRDQLLEMCTSFLKSAKQELSEFDTQNSIQTSIPASRQRSCSNPISPGYFSANIKFKKTRKLAPMTNLHN